MRLATSALGLALLAAGAAGAEPAALYPGGMMSFTYRRIPFGLNGTFRSDGDVTDPSAFPASGPGATTAAYAEADGTAYLLVVGGLLNADESVDAAALFLRMPAPVAPGTYPVDKAGYTARFGFVDDATAVVLPADLTTTDFDTWVSAIQAPHKFLGVLGYITLTQVEAGLLQGMFSLTATDAVTGLPVLVPDGIFSVGTTVSVDGASWGGIKAGYRE